ncbi:MAG TPA: copper homeostasis membrane protein CopD [Xanthobacteraceae bacterium]|nr:copper homeostasis membrane protein CopD [Xanthobacteraceae bacterium]
MIDALIAVRAFHVAATVAAAGTIVFRLWIADPAVRGAGALGARLGGQFDRMAWASLALAVASAAAWLLLVAADMSERPVAAVLTGGVLPTVLASTRFGHVWIARLAVAAALAVYLLRPRSDERPFSVRAIVAGLLAAALLGALALAGHGGATPGATGIVHLASDAAHAIAAGIWVGGLVPLALLFAAARRDADDRALAAARAATRRFSTLGIACVATLLATGIVNTIFLVGSVPALLGTPYGQLLTVKIALFLVMVATAAVNRLKLTPRLPDGAAEAMRPLQRNSLFEAALGLVILVIVGALGAIPPAVHVEPWWPLSFRFDGEALAAPPLRVNVVVAAASAAVVIAAAIAAVLGRRRRTAIALGLAATAALLWNLQYLTVPAFPTSFDRSPTGFTVASIARGEDLFATHCAGCHGRAGRGNGPNALALDMEASDLTADHVYAHPDGDLFWWIGHGFEETMPGFAGTIDAAARWNLIDFIHANADATRLQGRDRRGPNAFPAPAMTVDCPDGSRTLADLAGRFVRLVVTDGGAVPPSAADGAGVLTVVVPVDGREHATSACTVPDADAAKALSIYRGDGTAIAGTQFLVDPQGRLRAMWYPGLTPDWNDPAALAREVATLRATPAIGRPVQPGGHAH